MPSGSTVTPGTEVIWFIVFMAAFYAIQVPLRRTWQLSLEGVWLTGFAALAVTFYFRVGINLLLMTGVCLALLVAVALAKALSLRRVLRIARELPPEVAAGVPFTVIYRLTNTSRSWVAGLSLRDRAMRGILPLAGSADTRVPSGKVLAPPRISLAEYDAGRFEDDPFDLHPQQRAAPVFSPLRLFLKPGEELVLEQPVVFGARGLYRLGPVEAVVKDPMGIHGIATLLPAWDALRVLPRWDRLEYLPRELYTLWRQEEETSDDREGLSTEFRGIREYRPGDPLKSVHWPLTARHGQLVVKQFQQQVGQAWGLILDCHEGPELGVGPQSDQERAVSVVASLAAALDAEQRPFVVYLAMQRPLALQSPGEGMAHEEILRTLAAVRFDRRGGLDLSLNEAHQRFPDIPWLLITTRPTGDVIAALEQCRNFQPAPAVAYLDHTALAKLIPQHRTLDRSELLPTYEQAMEFIGQARGVGAAVYHILSDTPLTRAFEPSTEALDERFTAGEWRVGAKV